MRLNANDSWWGTDVPVEEGGGGPNVQTVVFTSIPDNTARVASLTGGEITGADGLTPDDEPRQGEAVERQLGLPSGAAIRRQRFIVIGEGPGLEMFEISGEQREAAGLADFGLNHISLYCDDLEGSRDRLVAAGDEALSEI